jgi:putative acetyltransferase
MHIRPAQFSDAPVLMQLFYDTVHHVNCQDYSQEQVNAWAPALTDEGHWQPQFLSQWTFVAEEGSEIVGFCELERDGHIGCFYCHYQHQRQGVGSLLLHHLEAIAKLSFAPRVRTQSLHPESALQQRINRLHTEASITAKPFFERWGFRVVQAQEVERYGVMLRNFLMDKNLNAP